MKFINKKDINLLKEMVRTDFKLRYQGSVLGYGWSLLKPLMLFGVLFVVFTQFLRFGEGVPNFKISLLLGIVMWTFFTESTSVALSSIVARGDLIRKIDIPRYLIVFSSTVSALINLILNLIVVFVFAYFSGVDFGLITLLLPIVLLELYILSVALAFLLGSLYVRFRDISQIWEVFLQALFYLTPIIYPISLVRQYSETAVSVMILNPLAQIISDAQAVLVSTETEQVYDIHNGLIQLVPFSIIIIIAFFGYRTYMKRSPYFAENV